MVVASTSVPRGHMLEPRVNTLLIHASFLLLQQTLDLIPSDAQ
jgi:hypothetical protein